MTKTYINNAVIGNSRMLGCISDRGELVRLFWPNIDYPQHVERLAAGVFFCERKNSTLWLDSNLCKHSQRYVRDTNILETVCTMIEGPLKVTQTDLCLPGEDIAIRHYDIENFGEDSFDIGFMVYSSFITTTPELRSSLFDFGCEALIHYRHGYYIAISSDMDAYQFQLGNDAFGSASSTELRGCDNIGMMPDGAVSWKLGRLERGGSKSFNLYISAASTLKGVKQLVRKARKSDYLEAYGITKDYWRNFVRESKHVETGNAEVDDLYKRSLLVFSLMSDERTGGLLAAPEIDEGFTKCGRYAYCWGRDAAFITGALDKCGLTAVVDKFYKWAADIQDEDGSWQQRYHMDGNLAPSWGIQIDETGTLIWGMLRHYEITGNISFLREMWGSVRKGVEFLTDFIDAETGLPAPSYDLWEERVGEHAYSSAAVYGGIRAGADIAGILGIHDEMAERWKLVAEGIKAAIEKNLWKEEWQRFIRSIRTKLNPWGAEPSQNTTVIKVNPKGCFRDVTLEDGMVDVSLLGLCVPFEVFDHEDLRIQNTVDVIEKVLTSHGIGGIKRYESDGYIGGNPWVLTTLWVALYHIKTKNYKKAREYFYWAVKGRTGLDLLPEQVSRENGSPIWVIPLTWSHAMFVLVLMELLEAGEL